MKPTSRLDRTTAGVAEDHETLISAATEVIAAGQQLILDRIDLLQAEAVSEAQRWAIASGFLAGAATLGLLAWTLLTVALGVLLSRWLPLDASLGICAVLNGALAGILGFLGRRQLARPSRLDRLAAVPEDDHGWPPGFEANPKLTEASHA
jgi:hypothetical protein